MNLTCQEARERLLEGALDATLSAHIGSCDACRMFAFELESIDSELAALPRVDAPELLVEETLARLRADPGLHLVHTDTESVQASVVKFAPAPTAAPEVRADAPLGLGSLLLAALSMLISAVGALVFLPLTLLTWLRDLLVGGVAGQQSAEAPHVPTKAPSVGDATLSEDIATLQKSKRGWVLPVVITSGVCATGGLVFFAFSTNVNSRIYEASATMGTMGGFEEQEAPIQYVTPAASAEPPASAAAVAASTPSSPFGYGRVTGSDPLAEIQALARGEESPPVEHNNIGGGASFGFGGLGMRGTGRGGGGTGEGTIGLGNFRTIGHGADSNHEAPSDEPSVVSTEAASTRRAPTRVTSRTGFDGEAPAEGRDDSGRFADRVDHSEFNADLAQRQQGERLAQDETGEITEGLDERSRALRGLSGGGGGGGVFMDEANMDVDGISATTSAGRASVPSAWAEAQRTTGLTFAAHDGWWENTYVPGDSAIRMLQARVASAGYQYLSNAELARPTTPSVAAPTERAMAVGVHADRAAIEGPTRVRVEVGLRGIAQAAGRRGALRIALVIDAEDALDASAQARIRSLVSSLSRSAGSRDRVMLVASGAHGGTLVPLGAMRAGTVEVALRHLFGAGDRSATQTSLTEAVSAAVQGVTSDDGAGLVLLATPDGVHDAALEEVIRQGALGGVVTSAIGIAPSATTNLDAIALAGQGRRGLVLSDADANRVVRSELTATARLIARALRLRVRLAPGVELIDVLGSHPLNQEESRRTRATETAIDQQLSRRLGIASDRDDDQDGIRILLPSFYAGDSHTVVLDLLVTRPGPVVDVDVQFKDLVRLGNGNVSAALSLPSGTAARGVREQHVLASYIAHRVSIGLAAAGDLASRGDWSGATSRIEEVRTLIADARREVPALANLPSVQSDEALLAQYLTAVGGGLLPQHVGDSLHYASHRRLLLPQLATIE